MHAGGRAALLPFGRSSPGYRSGGSCILRELDGLDDRVETLPECAELGVGSAREKQGSSVLTADPDQIFDHLLALGEVGDAAQRGPPADGAAFYAAGPDPVVRKTRRHALRDLLIRAGEQHFVR